jgi:hypothetical protein
MKFCSVLAAERIAITSAMPAMFMRQLARESRVQRCVRALADQPTSLCGEHMGVVHYYTQWFRA